MLFTILSIMKTRILAQKKGTEKSMLEQIGGWVLILLVLFVVGFFIWRAQKTGMSLKWFG